MVANSTTLGLNVLLGQWWDPDMLSNSYIKVSYAFTIIGFMVESTLKFIDDTRCKSHGNTIFKTKLYSIFISKELTYGAIYKFQCGFCHESYYGECVRHLNVRIGQHIGISPLTKKKVKPKGSAVSDHSLLCTHSPSFENFSVLTKEYKKFLLELKESLLIIRDKPSLNRNIRSAPLCPFDKI